MKLEIDRDKIKSIALNVLIDQYMKVKHSKINGLRPEDKEMFDRIFSGLDEKELRFQYHTHGRKLTEEEMEQEKSAYRSIVL